MIDFRESFRALTTYHPFHWQEELFARMNTGHIPDSCDIPTGLGKTNVMAVWLVALASQLARLDRRIPLRLVYVVDRRAVVDQATVEAESLVKMIEGARRGGNDDLLPVVDALSTQFNPDQPLIAISTLRGQMADNREWCLDPSRPAIVVGTVDMIGSRLLFSGYGRVGINHRSLQAGLLGQDSMIVIDEAHLSPSFVRTVLAVRSHIQRFPEIRPFRVMSLSATLSMRGNSLTLDEAMECRNEVAERRLRARKRIEWLPIDTAPGGNKLSEKQARDLFAETVVERALKYETNPEEPERRSVIIFANTVERVNQITEKLRKALSGKGQKKDGGLDKFIEDRVLKMTGEMRGWERDQLVETDKFKAFLPTRDRSITGATRYLVATSCVEVGVNIDADHAICDLNTLDSMIQRIGRVNRMGLVGGRGSTISVVVDLSSIRDGQAGFEGIERYKAERRQLASEIEASQGDKKTLKSLKSKEDKLKKAEPDTGNLELFYTWKALSSREDEEGKIDASPLALRGLLSGNPDSVPPEPVTPRLDQAKIDDWAMTSFKQSEFRRPLVHYWLRGVIDDERSETTLVWRRELDRALSAEDGYSAHLAELATTISVQMQERASVSTDRAAKIVREMAIKHPDHFIVIIDPAGDVRAVRLSEFGRKPDQKQIFGQIVFATVILPACIGGMDLDGNPDSAGTYSPDVLSRDHWSRYLIERRSADSYAISSLDSDSGDPSIVPTLKAAFGQITGRGLLLVNRKQVEDLFMSDEERPVMTVACVRHKRPENADSCQSGDGDDENSLSLSRSRSVSAHDQDVERYARILALRIGLTDEMIAILAAAGFGHDTGKARQWWQRAIGNMGDWQTNPLAKSMNNSFDHSYNLGYRHEFGSLAESLRDQSLESLADRDLILHLIASHHGYSRPHFPERAFDRGLPAQVNRQIAREAMLRFNHLQRRYGWWQLAYLESILKAADALASRDFSKGLIGGEE